MPVTRSLGWWHAVNGGTPGFSSHGPRRRTDRAGPVESGGALHPDRGPVGVEVDHDHGRPLRGEPVGGGGADAARGAGDEGDPGVQRSHAA